MLRLVCIFTLACLLGVFLQSTLIHGTVPSAAAPDVLMILVVIIALRVRTVGAVIGAFCLGLISDFASGQYVGPNAAASVVVFSLVGAIASRVYADRALALMVIVFLCSLAKSFTLFAIYSIYLDRYLLETLQYTFLRILVLEALFSSLVAPLVMRLLLLSQP
ncbi:MAG TPA: rod shape-determining protein MreD, partial [Oligoflexia bacterium]|nr:rod shape-determining protein MreD [Oligoflexia bacterium]